MNLRACWPLPHPVITFFSSLPYTHSTGATEVICLLPEHACCLCAGWSLIMLCLALSHPFDFRLYITKKMVPLNYSNESSHQIIMLLCSHANSPRDTFLPFHIFCIQSSSLSSLLESISPVLFSALSPAHKTVPILDYRHLDDRFWMKLKKGRKGRKIGYTPGIPKKGSKSGYWRIQWVASWGSLKLCLLFLNLESEMVGLYYKETSAQDSISLLGLL